MYSVLSLLGSICVIAFFVGMAKPGIVVPGSKRTRRRVAIYYLCGTALFMVIRTQFENSPPASVTESVPAVVQPTITIPHAKSYTVLQSTNSTVAHRKRETVSILAPEAETMEQRAETAIKAAIELREKNNADVIMVLLEADESLIGQGLSLAIARYAPDGKGWGSNDWKWQTLAADGNVSKDQDQIPSLKKYEFSGMEYITSESP